VILFVASTLYTVAASSVAQLVTDSRDVRDAQTLYCVAVVLSA
jgi:hypothetical protein